MLRATTLLAVSVLPTPVLDSSGHAAAPLAASDSSAPVSVPPTSVLDLSSHATVPLAVSDKSTPINTNSDNTSTTPQSSPQEDLQPIIALGDELKAECESLPPSVSAPGNLGDSLSSNPSQSPERLLRERRVTRGKKRGGRRRARHR